LLSTTTYTCTGSAQQHLQAELAEYVAGMTTIKKSKLHFHWASTATPSGRISTICSSYDDNQEILMSAIRNLMGPFWFLVEVVTINLQETSHGIKLSTI
jgi:hypothetical protein